MRKLIVSMNITLDGYMAGPACELDWHFKRWSDDMTATLTSELLKADTILLGRNTYRAMARYWPGKASDFLCPPADLRFAEMMNQYRKVVLSETINNPEWNNSTVFSGDLKSQVRRLRNESGYKKNIIVYGSASLVLSLIEMRLVDEYQLWLHPVLLGRGKPMFRPLPNIENLLLQRTAVFSSGVVFLCYDV